MNRSAWEMYIATNSHNQELFGMQYVIKLSESPQIPIRSPTHYNTGNHCNYTTEKCKRYTILPF